MHLGPSADNGFLRESGVGSRESGVVCGYCGNDTTAS